MVPGSFGCGSVVLAATITLAPSRAARTAMASPIPRLAPVMNNVFPFRSAIPASARSGVADHLLRPNPLIELLRRHQPELEGGFPQSLVLLVRLLGDLRGIVVADVRIERRHQHQRSLQVLLDALVVGLDALRTVLAEAPHAVRQQPGGVEEVVDDEWLVDVQLEVPGRSADAH